jgi:hypothetical protein
MPVTGFLNAASPGPLRQQIAAFHEGLKESGYVEGHPQSYAMLLGKVLPLQIERLSTTTAEYKTIEELQQALRERGLPVERIYPLLNFKPKERA